MGGLGGLFSVVLQDGWTAGLGWLVFGSIAGRLAQAGWLAGRLVFSSIAGRLA